MAERKQAAQAEEGRISSLWGLSWPSSSCPTVSHNKGWETTGAEVTMICGNEPKVFKMPPEESCPFKILQSCASGTRGWVFWAC